MARRAKQLARPRMTGRERREQLVSVARSVFAEKGFEPASVEEIAARAEVSKPVVYEHFGGKEGIYAVVVDREVQDLSNRLTAALGVRDHPKRIVERTALALLDYVEENEDGFRILVRDSPVAQATGPFSSMLGDIARTVEALLATEFHNRGLDPATATLYAQMLVGMIAFTGQWWLEAKEPDKATVAAHLTNLGWNGLRGMEPAPRLTAGAYTAGAYTAGAYPAGTRRSDAAARPANPGDAQGGDAAS
ncbi:MAG: TetR/AcrR family transcriptional regulator [Bifidobacteriaceae bacterium]|nr:TetR/AcrR family transcriptional regulator [Bifidobacteriaceae bacterium]